MPVNRHFRGILMNRLGSGDGSSPSDFRNDIKQRIKPVIAAACVLNHMVDKIIPIFQISVHPAAYTHGLRVLSRIVGD